MDRNDDQLLRPEEVAALLGRSVAALAQLRYRGTGPTYIRAGGRIRYRLSHIDGWLEEGKRTST